MNSRAALLFILSFIFVYMWMPLHFDSDHFESKLSAEVRQVGTVLHKDLRDWVTHNALKLTSLKETTVFPESKIRDESEALFEEKRDNIWNIPYFQSLRALTKLAVFRLFIALVWVLVLLPAPLAVLVDGFFERKLKFEATAAPHPVLYKVALSAPIYLGGFFALSLIWPYPAYVWLIQAAFVLFLIALHTVTANFHKFN